MKLSDSDINEIISIVTNYGKGVRKTKPKHDNSKPNTGRAAYVWRNVVFMISKNPQHQCLPVMAEYYLCDEDFGKGIEVGREALDHRNAVRKELNEIVSQIVDSIPMAERHGLNRWARILK